MDTLHPSTPPAPSDSSADSSVSADAAAIELIRQKVARAYGEEPAAASQLARAELARTPSKHQRYMHELSSSGKSLAEIQTAWHYYYTNLPDREKHEVWQEFYAASQHTPYQKLFQKQAPVPQRPQSPLPPVAAASPEPAAPAMGLPQPAAEPRRAPSAARSTSAVPATKKRSKKLRDRVPGKKKLPPLGTPTAANRRAAAPADLQQRIRRTVSANGKLSTKHHVQSLLFGLGMGLMVLAILLFSFFNEMIIAPFIQPSRKVNSQPIIVGTSSAAASAQPTVIVPKINIQIPVDFTLPSNDETTVQNSLENGVVHYPSTVKPGQNGNGAYFGHSSQNIFNNGKYKFAFVLLHQVTTGDIFYVTYGGKVYAYQVFAKEVVPPTKVEVLNDTKGKQATAVLITCDPPGLNTNRLVVWGEQISPSPTSNSAPAPAVTTQPEQITDNGPTLWQRITNALSFWN